MKPSAATHTLWDVGTDQQVTITSVDSSLARRCLALGLRAGAEVSVVQRRDGGLVVLAGGTRVALGQDMAEKLIIERAS